MDTKTITRDVAAEKFVELLTNAIYSVGHEQYMEMLVTGQPKNTMNSLSEWYLNLTEEDREKVEKIVKDVMHFTIVGFLCLLDGVSGFDRFDGKPTNYPLFFELYRDIATLKQNDSEASIRINPIDQHDPYLHDIFQTLTETT